MGRDEYATSRTIGVQSTRLLEILITVATMEKEQRDARDIRLQILTDSLLYIKVHAANTHDTKARKYMISHALQIYLSLIDVCIETGQLKSSNNNKILSHPTGRCKKFQHEFTYSNKHRQALSHIISAQKP